MSFPSDLEIASQATLQPLSDIAADAGIPAECLEPYGSGAAKITLDAIDKMADRPRAKYVVVSAITPTPLGEGKTTTTVGLGQAFQHIGSSATIAIRQPSMGPTFGIKGGAAGGGYSGTSDATETERPASAVETLSQVPGGQEGLEDLLSERPTERADEPQKGPAAAAPWLRKLAAAQAESASTPAR